MIAVSNVYKIPELNGFDFKREKNRIIRMELKEQKFIESIGYNNVAKCIEKEFNGSYHEFKKAMKRQEL